MPKYQVGQYICFNESRKSLNSSFQELEVYDEWDDNQIANITEQGKYIFEDFSGEWDESIISGLSDDQRIDYGYIINNQAILEDTINEISNFHGISNESARLLCTDELMCEIVEVMFSAQEEYIQNMKIYNKEEIK